MKNLNKALLTLLLISTGANATPITFDEVSNTSALPLVANGYAGLNWNSFRLTNGTVHAVGTGYYNSVISANNVIFNSGGAPASFSSSATPFTFNNAYFTAAWHNGLNVNVTGSLNGASVYTRSLVLNTTAASFETFNWVGIDTVSFSAFGGTDRRDDAGSGTHFAIDNLSIGSAVAVPEPASILLFSLGLLGVAAVGRRKSAQ